MPDETFDARENGTAAVRKEHRLNVHGIPGRVIAGAYILHAGLEKWHGDEATAEVLHSMAGDTPYLFTGRCTL